MTTARELAYRALTRIEEDDGYSHIVLSGYLEKSELSPEDKRLATNLVYGTLTWRRALDRLIASASSRPLPHIESSVLRILRLGVYQIAFLRVPNHAAVDESVNLAKIKAEFAPGFVNAVLRNVIKGKPDLWWNEKDLERKPIRYFGDRYSLPGWICNRLVQTLGFEEATLAAEAFNKPPDVWARDRQAESEPVKIENFEERRAEIESGTLLVQDLGARYAVLACGDVAGKSVLDACAGLGGKAMFLADRGADVVAVEPHKKRLAKLVHDRVRNHVGEIQSFKSDELFDVVLVDAPCTGLGVLRRHPETRWKKEESDIQSLIGIQSTILNASAQFVKPGGLLVYCVCTFTREETSKQVEQFLARSDSSAVAEQAQETSSAVAEQAQETSSAVAEQAQENKFEPSSFDIPDTLKSDSGSVQLWPHIHGSDAFFISVLKRKT